MLKIKKASFFHGDTAYAFFSAGSITKYRYEGEETRPAEISFFGKDEQPLGLKDLGNAASYQFTYTNAGIASIKALSTDGSPVAVDKDSFGDNVVEVLIDWNDIGTIAKLSFRGKDGNPVLSSVTSCASIRFKYDESGRETEVSQGAEKRRSRKSVADRGADPLGQGKCRRNIALRNRR